MLFGACGSVREGAERAPDSRAGQPPDHPAVGLVQLFGGTDEQAVPVLMLDRPGVLTLAFDVLSDTLEALSVHYIPLDLQGREVGFTAGFIEGFSRDDLVQPRTSGPTAVRYLHFRHSFPQNGMRFLRSGRYKAVVTPFGRDEVLFERTFFVTEAVPVRFGLQEVLLPGVMGGQPVLEVPISPEWMMPMQNIVACFTLAGALDAPTCTDQPTFVEAGRHLYALPQRGRFLNQDPGGFDVDLTTLNISNEIERVDLSSVPFVVQYRVHEAAFPNLRSEVANGQSRVHSVNVNAAGPPETSGEYVQVEVALVPPDEMPLRSLWVRPGFRPFGPNVPLAWNESRRRYEGQILLKQGVHSLRYGSSDPRFQAWVRDLLPRLDPVYHAWLWYRDPITQHDRLLSFESYAAL